MKISFTKVMMSIIILLIAGFLLMTGGCESKKTGNMGRDGYRFESAEKVITDPQIHVVLVNSPDEMFQLYYDKTGKKMPDNVRLSAFAILYPTHPEVCTLYMLDPRTTKYEPEFIGHEFAHCVFGQWHPTQDKRRGQG